MADVNELTRLINNEISKAMNLHVDGWISKRLHPLLSRGTRRFSEIFTEVDRVVGERGLAEGARALLPYLVDHIEICGAENIPPQGPLVVASNHPGTVDSVMITSGVARADFKIIASDVPFLQNLPNISRYMIFTPKDDPHGRMAVVRESVRHLRSGGSLLLFARAGIDPDPSFMPHADEELALWSRSLQIFLERVPNCRVLVTVVSGVLHPRYMRHPFTWVRRKRPDRQRLAMVAQVIHQMLGRKVELTPRVTFGELIGISEMGNARRTLGCITESARRLLRYHMLQQNET